MTRILGSKLPRRGRSRPPGLARRASARLPSGRSRSSSPGLHARRSGDGPGERFEREAERAALRVVGGRSARPLAAAGRAGGARAGEPAPPVVREVLGRAGRPLDPETRDFMESRFGHDFGRVRVHSDRRAAEAAEAVDARAFAAGSDLVFAEGEYAPGSGRGRRLLAHELAHVVQQAPAAGAGTAGGRVSSIQCQWQEQRGVVLVPGQRLSGEAQVGPRVVANLQNVLGFFFDTPLTGSFHHKGALQLATVLALEAERCSERLDVINIVSSVPRSLNDVLGWIELLDSIIQVVSRRLEEGVYRPCRRELARRYRSAFEEVRAGMLPAGLRARAESFLPQRPEQ